MKHITYSDKSLLLGDEIADLILEYAAALANLGRADAVEVHSISSDGDDVMATLLLDAGAPLMIESSTTTVAEPDNQEAIDYVRSRLPLLEYPSASGIDSDIAPAATEDFPELDRGLPGS